MRAGPIATRIAIAIAAAMIPPRESVIQSASITTGSAATASDRHHREAEAAANKVSKAIAAAVTAARPFQYPIG